jgi:predicted enzyme related to lactoylglutathione lyase
MPAKKKAKKTTTKKKTTKKAPAKTGRKKAKAAQALPVVHWEIAAKSPERVQKFYGELFSWRMQTNEEFQYSMVESKNQREGIAGGIGPSQGPSGVTFYVQVDDIPSYLKKVETLGGKTVMPRTELPMVTMAMFQDVEGNRIGLVEERS